MVPEGHSNSPDLGKLKGLLAALSDFTSCWKLWAPHLHQRLAGEKLVKLCSGAASSWGGVGERVPSLSAAFGVWWGLQGCRVRRWAGVKGGGVRSGHAHSTPAGKCFRSVGKLAMSPGGPVARTSRACLAPPDCSGHQRGWLTLTPTGS